MVADKEIERLAKLSRRLGLKRIRVDGLEMEFGPAPLKPSKSKQEENPDPEEDELFDAVK